MLYLGGREGHMSHELIVEVVAEEWKNPHTHTVASSLPAIHEQLNRPRFSTSSTTYLSTAYKIEIPPTMPEPNDNTIVSHTTNDMVLANLEI